MKGMLYFSSAFPRLHRFLTHPIYLFRLWRIRRYPSRRSEGAAVMSCLTEREKWLMRQAYEQAIGLVADFYCLEVPHIQTVFPFDQWLEGSAADAVTIEMVLAEYAPKDGEAKDRQS